MATTRMSFEERSTQLLDVAEALFCERGYESVSVEDIARTAGVSRPIVYQHHGSKENLFLECARRARTEFEAALEQAHLDAEGDLSTFIEAGGAQLFDLLYNRPSRWAMLFSTALGENGQLAADLTALRFGTVGKLAALAGEYAPQLGPERLQALANAVSGMSEAFCRWSLHAPEIPRERILGYHRAFVTSIMGAALDGGLPT